MKRVLVGLTLLACVAGAIGIWYWYWYPAEPEPFPYARQVPAHAVVYIAIPDLPAAVDEINRHPRWKEVLPLENILSRVKNNRAHLAGPAAIFATWEGDQLSWTSLVKLKNGKTHIEGVPYEGEFNILHTLEPLQNHEPRPRVILNIGVLPQIYQDIWNDFSHAVLDVKFGESLVISGSLLYRGGSYRDILENRVNASPVPDPGDVPFAVSGVTNIDDLWTLLELPASIPEYDRSVLGPEWGVQLNSPEDISFWCALSEKPITLEGISWRDFQTRVEGARWLAFTKSPFKPGSPSDYHQIIHLRMPQAADIFRSRFGDRGDPLLGYLERFKRIKSRLTYSGQYASISVTLTLP